MEELNEKASRLLHEQRHELAEAITTRHYLLQPDLLARYGIVGRARCVQDVSYHLTYLSTAISTASSLLFANYIGWAKIVLSKRGIAPDMLAFNLECMRDVLAEALADDVWAIADEYLQLGRHVLAVATPDPPSFIDTGSSYGNLAKRYLDALLRYEHRAAGKIIIDAVNAGVSIQDIYLRVIQCSQYEIGRLWQINQLSVAREHYCSAATQLTIAQLYPYIFSVKKHGRRLVTACVAEELHEIGAHILSDFFELAGWDTCYLGANLPTPDIIRAVVERKAQVLALSVTMAFHLRTLKQTIRAIRESPECKYVKILVGGYPFNVDRDLWRTVGADGSAVDAQEAVTIAERLIRKRGGRS